MGAPVIGIATEIQLRKVGDKAIGLAEKQQIGGVAAGIEQLVPCR